MGGAPGATRPPGHRYLLLSRGGATGSGGKYRVAHRQACGPRRAAPQHRFSRAPEPPRAHPWAGDRAGGGWPV